MSAVDKDPIPRIPLAERRRLRDARIRSMYRKDPRTGKPRFSMNEIVKEIGCSKDTVFRAINRPKTKNKNKK